MAILLTNSDDNISYANAVGPLEVYGLDGNDSITGTLENDHIDGGSGNDRLFGDGGTDTLIGSDGNDFLQAGAGADTHNYLDGGDGNDVLVAGSYSDTLVGGNGNDVYVLDTNFIFFSFATSDPGQDRVEQGAQSFTLESLPDIEDLTLTGVGAAPDLDSFGIGNDKANTIIGNNYDNVLDGKGGNDLIRGMGGNDTLTGGFDVGGTPEYLYGGTGNDTYVVMDLMDTPVEFAGEGHDTVQSSIRWVLGANLEDLTLTGTDSVNAFGNELDNKLTGNSGNNYLQGSTGLDTLAGGAGNDYYELGDRSATGFFYDIVVEGPNAGIDFVNVTPIVSQTPGNNYYTLTANVENGAIVTSGSVGIAFNLFGNELDNVLTGSGDAQTGNSSVNQLYGMDGNDTLNGLYGLDTLIGGTGNDTYDLADRNYVGQFDGYDYDTVVEDPNAGIDTVRVTPIVDQNFSSSYTLVANVENGVLLGSLAFNLSGNALANMLTGNSAANTLFGGAGSDTLSGGDGNDTLVGNDDVFANVADTLYGNNGNDTILGEPTDNVNGGSDTDFLFAVNANPWSIDLGATGFEWMSAGFGDDTINAATQTVRVDVFAGGGNDTVTGSSFDDNLWGGAGNDTLNGGGGNDLLFGDVGADALSGGPGNDTIYADSADTLIDGGTGTDAFYWAAGVNANIDLGADSIEFAQTLGDNDTLNGTTSAANLVLFAGAGNDTITGGAGNDFLWGEAGNDAITGGAGNDTLVGGLGIDTLTGGAGTDNIYGNGGTGGDSMADTYVFGAGWGTDFVYDFDNGTDHFNMNGSGATSFGALTVTNSGGHARIAFDGNLIVVVNATGQIDASDFFFS